MPAELWTECEYYSDSNHFIVQWIKRELLRHCNDGQSPENSKWFEKKERTTEIQKMATTKMHLIGKSQCISLVSFFSFTLCNCFASINKMMQTNSRGNGTNDIFLLKQKIITMQKWDATFQLNEYNSLIISVPLCDWLFATFAFLWNGYRWCWWWIFSFLHSLSPARLTEQ